jgi:hypothetical protein
MVAVTLLVSALVLIVRSPALLNKATGARVV